MLTGGRGMVGRNFLEHPGTSNLEILAPTSQELDLRDYSAVRSYMLANRPEIVVHAAGRVGGIQANIKHPVVFFTENLDMARNVIGAARLCGIKKLINLGSSCMYPRNAPNPLHEEMILQGELEPTNEGYALAKISAARFCDYIRREDGEYQYKTLVPCNIYGRFDNFDPERSHMVPAVIHKMHVAKSKDQDEVTIWGDGMARREFMYAGDLADCMVEAVKRIDTMPGTMNVGPGTDYTIDEYYQVISGVVGYQGQFVHDLSKPIGMTKKLVSIERLHRWGWHPTTPLRDGLEKTYAYYLELTDGRH